MEKLCFAEIETKYSTLTTAEKKIADVILREKEKIVDMSTAELSSLAGTAPSAVIRLCTTLGFDGFFQTRDSASSAYTPDF